jgi:hypothetical protein
VKTYLITFRGHGHLSETKTIDATEAGLTSAAASSAEYWCRSNRSPFCVYTVHDAFPQIGQDLVATVTVDVDAPYTVFVVDQHSGKEFGHDFRRKADAESFHNRCIDAGVKARDVRLVIWLNKKPSRVAG